MKRLLRLTALALGLTLLLSACGHKNTEPERKDAATQTVPVEGITGLTLCDGDVTLRFEKNEEGSWIWHDNPTFPLEQSAMDELLALPAALDGGETVTDGQELSVYGLETPAKYITVTADGEDATYYVGEETTDGTSSRRTTGCCTPPPRTRRCSAAASTIWRCCRSCR